jgi:hypothetical protein
MANSKTIYEELCEIQKLLWEDDDMMGQDTLFEAQDKLANVLLTIADKTGKVDDLVKTFPWIYETKEV